MKNNKLKCLNYRLLRLAADGDGASNSKTFQFFVPDPPLLNWFKVFTFCNGQLQIMCNIQPPKYVKLMLAMFASFNNTVVNILWISIYYNYTTPKDDSDGA